ncbi:MAG: hypothetical protein KGZ85_04290, partial [Ignavibacterium sp.]|nr:hypothetical protein [Ignavibacterium sp.]
MLAKILSHKEKLQVIILLFIVIIMAFSQALGVASIMPFISLIMDPDLVYQNEYLNWAYNYFSFADAKAFIIAFGILMLLIIIISNAVTTLSMYARIRFTWMNNHRLSSRLLEKYLSRSYDYFLNKHSTTLSKNVLSEVNHLTTSFIIPLLLFVSNGILLLFIMGMLLFVNVTTT